MRSATLRKLRFPIPEHPSDATVDETLVEQADELVTELNRSGNPWFVPRFRLDVSSGTDTYAIGALAPDFGTGRFIYTMDDTNPQHRTRYIPTVGEEELVRFHRGGDPLLITTTQTTGIKHSAEAMAFTYTDGQWYIKVGPIPNATASYWVLYEPDVMRPSADEDTVFRLRNFENLLTDRGAIVVMEHAEWPGLSEEQNERRRDRLLVSLVNDSERRAELFRRYKHGSFEEGPIKMVPWGRRRWRGR